VYPVYVQKSRGAFPSSNNRHPAPVAWNRKARIALALRAIPRESAVATHRHMNCTQQTRCRFKAAATMLVPSLRRVYRKATHLPSRELLLLPDEKCGNSEFSG